MATESRIKRTLLNARVNLIFYFLTLILSFLSRKIFLNCLGTDFIGLSGTLQNLLGFLNLAELGVGSAIGYLLYKPLYDHDQHKINEIISVMGYLYHWIGLIILSCGIILSLFFPLIFPDSNTKFHLSLIYFAFYTFLASSLIGYFINYRQNLLGADQRNYIITAYYQSVTIAKTIIQMYSAYQTGSYYLWVAIELTFGIIYSLILNWKIARTYPWLQTEISEGRKLFKKYPEVITYCKQIFVQKIACVVRFEAKNLLIYAFTTLEAVAFYNNYAIIIDKIFILSNNIFNGTEASIGNLIAEKNPTKIWNIYWELFCLRFLTAGILTYCIYKLAPSFITLWLGPEYILSSPAFFLICYSFFLDQNRTITERFLWCYGLFNDSQVAVIEALIGLGLSIVCGYLFGLPGILAGPLIIGTIIFLFWKPYFLFKEGIKKKLGKYYKEFSFYILSFILSIAITELFPLNSLKNAAYNEYGKWIAYSISIASIHSTIFITILSIFTVGGKLMILRFRKNIYDKLQTIRH